MQRRLACAALVAASLVCATLALARTGSAVPLCNVGQIVKTADPALSAPNPTYAGNTITSSGGSWSSCGVSLSGFYKEWLRDGTVVNGPTWVAGSPGPFTYVAQDADVGHRLTSAVRPCNDEGCYGSYGPSTNAVVPSASPLPPPVTVYPIVATGYIRDASGMGVSGATVQLYRDADTDTSVSQSALDEVTTDGSGYYVLHGANTGAVATDSAANDGWVNFAIEANGGDVPYYDVVARRWDSASGTWLATDDSGASTTDSSGTSTSSGGALTVDIAPTQGSVSAGDWPSFVGSCKLATEKTTLVRTEVDPTTIGELHVAKDAIGTFSYGIGRRADSQISIGSSVGGWHLGGYKHIATDNTVTVAATNTGDDWARQIRSRFQYGLYRHERSTIDWRTGQPISCGTSYTKEPRAWVGNIELGADLSGKLHLCLTKYARWAVPFPPYTEFHRFSGRLQTWQGAVSVDLGVGRLNLSAWSGASKSVGYDYRFGLAYDVHWLCGTDNWPALASRIFAGG